MTEEITLTIPSLNSLFEKIKKEIIYNGPTNCTALTIKNYNCEVIVNLPKSLKYIKLTSVYSINEIVYALQHTQLGNVEKISVKDGKGYSYDLFTSKISKVCSLPDSTIESTVESSTIESSTIEITDETK